MKKKTHRPTKIAKYEIKRRIGRGSMGAVYEAYDPFVQRTVAIKVAHSQEGMDSAAKQKVREGFFSEVYSAGRMHHPSVVGVYDAGQQDDYNYIVMEFVDGVTLQEFVTGKKTLTFNQIVDVIYQCAKGLDYVHRQSVIHRDIKPGNIMFSTEGEVKIMDFSIAHVDVGWDNPESEVQGSPMYMPPEQLSEEKRLVAQSDIYSLGAVMYALLAKRTPFKASNLDSLIYMISNLETDPLLEINPEIPEHVIEIVNKAMQKIIYDRYETAQQFADDLSHAYRRLRKIGENIDIQEQKTILHFLSFFKDFNEEQISEVVHASEWKEFVKDDVIVTEGEKETSFFIIAKGGVDVYKKDRIIGTLKQGDCFGEIAFITRHPRAATIKARTNNVIVMEVSADLLEHASLETQLQYYRIFLENLVSRLSQTTEKLIDPSRVMPKL